MSATAKHSEGPWTAHDDGWQPWEGAIEIRGRDGTICWTTSGGNERANASLIAAAPEIYEELRTSRCPRPANNRPDEFTVGECVNARECGCSVGAAVARAEGQA